MRFWMYGIGWMGGWVRENEGGAVLLTTDLKGTAFTVVQLPQRGGRGHPTMGIVEGVPHPVGVLGGVDVHPQTKGFAPLVFAFLRRVEVMREG